MLRMFCDFDLRRCNLLQMRCCVDSFGVTVGCCGRVTDEAWCFSWPLHFSTSSRTRADRVSAVDSPLWGTPPGVTLV